MLSLCELAPRLADCKSRIREVHRREACVIVIAIVLGRRNDDNAAAAVRMGVEDTRQRRLCIHGLYSQLQRLIG